jgi:hypothetical protein
MCIRMREHSLRVKLVPIVMVALNCVDRMSHPSIRDRTVPFVYRISAARAQFSLCLLSLLVRKVTLATGGAHE